MGKEEEIKKDFAYMKKTKTTWFNYDSHFYILWLLIGFGVWIVLGSISHFVGEGFHSMERLFWWVWMIFSMFIWQQRNGKLVHKHNMQKIDSDFKEMYDARVNLSVIKELIELRKEKNNRKKANGTNSKKYNRKTKKSN